MSRQDAEDGGVVVQALSSNAVAQTGRIAESAVTLSQIVEGCAGDQVAIARVHADNSIGDAFQQSHRVVSGHDGVRRIVLHAEILAFRDGLENGEKNLLLLGELRVSPEAVLD